MGTTGTASAPLDRDAIIRAAIAHADAEGLAGLSMRRLGDRLGVRAMSLYHHVPNKAALLDAMVDDVYRESGLPAPDMPWRDALSDAYESLRASLVRHPWAIPLLDSRRTPGLPTLQRHDAVLGCLRAAGFSVRTSAHALSALDSYTVGFATQQVAIPFTAADPVAEVMAELLGDPIVLPHLAELGMELAAEPAYDYGDEFPIGLGYLLDRIGDELGRSGDELGR